MDPDRVELKAILLPSGEYSGQFSYLVDEMNQCGSLEGMALAFAEHVDMGQAVQLLVN
jgi:hypothetical protein